MALHQWLFLSLGKVFFFYSHDAVKESFDSLGLVGGVVGYALYAVGMAMIRYSIHLKWS